MKPSLLKSVSGLALLALAGASCLVAPSRAAAQSIDTTPSWSGHTIQTWGPYGSQTIGQTFTATPADAKLQDFSFFLGGETDYLHGQPVVSATNYQAYVYAWNSLTGTITGTALYTSTVMTTPGAILSPVVFNTGSLDLTSGQTYVLFVSTSGIANPADQAFLSSASIGVVNTDPYSDGAAVWAANGNNFALLSSTAWTDGGTSDLAFRADFLSAGATPIDTAQPFYGSSGLGATLDAHFTGGVLRIDQADATYAENFALDGSATNTIDAHGNTATFTGNFGPDATAVVSNLKLIDGVGGGLVKASGTWNAMGTITNAAAFELLPGGSITANSFINASAGTLTVDDGATLSGLLTQAGGSITNAGTLNGGVVITGGSMVTGGTINGGLTNAASFDAANGAVNGMIINQSGGQFYEQGAVTSDSTFTNQSGAALYVHGDYAVADVLANAGSVTVETGGTLTAARLVNSAVFSNSGVYNSDVDNSGAAAVLTNSATGVWNGNLTNGAGATASTAGTWNGAIANAGTVNASGRIDGAISNNGTFTVTGTLAENGSAFANIGALTVGGNAFTGAGAFTNAAGATISVGTSAANGTLGVASLNNGGALNLQNGKAGDRINVAGAYTGATGSSLALDVNLANGQSDRLVAGSLAGTTTLSLQNVGGGRAYLSTPIVLVSGSGKATFTAATDAQTQAVLSPSPHGLVDYHLQPLSGGGLGLVSTVDGAAASTVANPAALVLNTLNSDLRPPLQALVAPRGGEGWSGHVWMRATDAGNRMSATTTSNDGYSAPVGTRTRLDADGLVAGAEAQKTGVRTSLQLGVAAGWTQARATDGDGYASRFTVPSFGAYAVLSAPFLRVGAQAWHDDLSIRPDAAVADGTVHGHDDTLILSASSPITRGIFRFEPYVDYRASSAHIDPFTVAGGSGTLGVSSLPGDTTEGGLRLSATMIRNGMPIKPYVSIGAETVSGHGEHSIFTPTDGGMPVTLTTTGPGRYTRLTAGVDAQLATGLQAYAQVDNRSGSRVNSLAATVGVRKSF